MVYTIYISLFVLTIFVTYISKQINPNQNIFILMISKFLMVYGFSIILVSFLCIGNLPNDVEWPMEGESEIIRLKNGNILGIHSKIPRVQVYDKDLRFLHGFDIDVNGLFTIKMLDENSLEVFGYKNRIRLVYDLDGRRNSREVMNEDYKPETGKPLEKISFSTNTVDNPIASHSFGMGMFCLFLSLLIGNFTQTWYTPKKNK